MAKKKSFILYADYIKHIAKLTDEEAGRLFKAIFNYVNSGEIPNLDGMAAMAFSFISNQLDNDLQKYEEICKKRAENIKKRWDKTRENPKENSNFCNTNDTNEYNCNFCNTNDTDNDSDSDIDNVNDSDIDSGSVLHNIRPRGKHNTINITQNQYDDLCDKYGQAVINQYINRIDEYLFENKKKPYSNHYQTIIKWLESDKIKPLSSASTSYDFDAIFQKALEDTPKVKKEE